ncbi:hypothetical protein T06_10970, partial [Trichinella sp. T6]
LENSVPSNHVRRERKETIEQLKILYLPITFRVSEKRLRGLIFDKKPSNTTPSYAVVVLRRSCVCVWAGVVVRSF